ncbi:MAG: hypothetical protein QNJ92_17430 [Alphaproteobacteria bacterium]|nr:hypothetical protein [Alphaproteobacteria bacterium]
MTGKLGKGEAVVSLASVPQGTGGASRRNAPPPELAGVSSTLQQLERTAQNTEPPAPLVPLGLTAPEGARIVLFDGMPAEARMTSGMRLDDGRWFVPAKWIERAAIQPGPSGERPTQLIVTVLPATSPEDSPLQFSLSLPKADEPLPFMSGLELPNGTPDSFVGGRVRLAEPAEEDERLDLVNLPVQRDMRGISFVQAGGFVLAVEAAGYQREIRGMVFAGTAPAKVYRDLLRRVGLVTREPCKPRTLLAEARMADGRWYRLAAIRTDYGPVDPPQPDPATPPWLVEAPENRRMILPKPQPVTLSEALPEGADKVLVLGVPADATLSAGGPRGDGIWQVPPAELDGLMLEAPYQGGQAVTLAMEISAVTSEPPRPARLVDAHKPPAWLNIVHRALAAGAELLIDGVPPAATLSTGRRDPTSGQWRIVDRNALAGLQLTPLADLDMVKLTLRLEAPKELDDLKSGQSNVERGRNLLSRAETLQSETDAFSVDAEAKLEQAKRLERAALKGRQELDRLEAQIKGLSKKMQASTRMADAAKKAALAARARSKEQAERADVESKKAKILNVEAATCRRKAGLDEPVDGGRVAAIRGMGETLSNQSAAMRRRAMQAGFSGGISRVKAGALLRHAQEVGVAAEVAQERMVNRERKAELMAARAEELLGRTTRLRERAAQLGKRRDLRGRKKALARLKRMLREAGRLAGKANEARRELSTLSRQASVGAEMAAHLHSEAVTLARAGRENVSKGAMLRTEADRLEQSGRALIEAVDRVAEERRKAQESVENLLAQAQAAAHAAAAAQKDAETAKAEARRFATDAKRAEQEMRKLTERVAAVRRGVDQAAGMVRKNDQLAESLRARAEPALARASAMSEQAARMRQEGSARIADGEAMLKRGRALKSAITAFHHRIKRTVPARARLRRTHRFDVTVAVPPVHHIPELELMIDAPMPQDPKQARTLRLEGWGLDRLVACARQPDCDLAFVVTGVPEEAKLTSGYRDGRSGTWIVPSAEADGLALMGSASEDTLRGLSVGCLMWREDGISGWAESSAVRIEDVDDSADTRAVRATAAAMEEDAPRVIAGAAD